MSPIAPTVRLPLGPVEESPLPDFEVIREGLSTSQAPTNPSEWRWLRGQGVNTIVHLDSAMMDFAQFGFESFLWMPLGAGQPPNNADAEQFLMFVQLSDNQPTHLSGAAADARGLMVALVRYAIDEWPVDMALADGQRLNGGAELPPAQVGWLMDWAAIHPPGSHLRKSAPARPSPPVR